MEGCLYAILFQFLPSDTLISSAVVDLLSCKPYKQAERVAIASATRVLSSLY
jgi:hypothetical protein